MNSKFGDKLNRKYGARVTRHEQSPTDYYESTTKGVYPPFVWREIRETSDEQRLICKTNPISPPTLNTTWFTTRLNSSKSGNRPATKNMRNEPNLTKNIHKYSISKELQKCQTTQTQLINQKPQLRTHPGSKNAKQTQLQYRK